MPPRHEFEVTRTNTASRSLLEYDDVWHVDDIPKQCVIIVIEMIVLNNIDDARRVEHFGIALRYVTDETVMTTSSIIFFTRKPC